MARRLARTAAIIAALFGLQITDSARSQSGPTAPDSQVDLHQTYSVLRLGACGSNCFVGGINSSCEVVGSFDVTPDHLAFIWRPNLPAQQLEGKRPGPGSPTTFLAFTINDAHQVAGAGTGPLQRALLWTTSLSTSQWFAAPLHTNENLNEGYAINAAGIIVGAVKTITSSDAMRWDGAGTANLGDLPHPGALDQAFARGVNDAGAIVGIGRGVVNQTANQDRAFFRSVAGGMIDLGALNGLSVPTHAWAVNSNGVSVGDSATGSVTHAVRWSAPVSAAAPPITDLGALPMATPTALPNSVALAINDRNSVVGAASGNQVEHAVAWPAGSVTPIDLNSQLTNASGLIVVEARGINANGVIAARAKDNGQDVVVALVPSNFPGAASAQLCPPPPGMRFPRVVGRHQVPIDGQRPPRPPTSSLPDPH